MTKESEEACVGRKGCACNDRIHRFDSSVSRSVPDVLKRVRLSGGCKSQRLYQSFFVIEHGVSHSVCYIEFFWAGFIANTKERDARWDP